MPFLVPLMMVPENQVGVQKEFSFSQNPQTPQKNGIFSNVINQNNNRRKFNPPPNRGNFNPPPNRRFGSNRRTGRPLHNVPGPPYNGPPPRNPQLPMDDTIIHPSINRFRYRRPPRNFRQRVNYPRTPLYTSTPPPPPTTSSTTESSTTTSTETSTTKVRPQVIIMQQPPGGGYRPYQPYGYNQYPQYPPAYYPPPQYQPPHPATTTSTTPAPTTTTTTLTTTTTTKKPRRRRKKKQKSTMSPQRINALSQGQLTIMDNQLVPMDMVPSMLAQPSNNMFSNRLGMSSPPSGRRLQPKGILRGRRRFPTPSGRTRSRGMRGPRPMANNSFRRYVEYPRMPAREPGNRRFDMPNIYSQSGFDFETSDGKPPIRRPPPRHAGVKIPGIRVPPNAGNIQDIISPKPIPNPSSYPGPNANDRYSTNDGKYTIINDFRPPIGSKPSTYQPAGSYVPPNQPQINYNKPEYQKPKPQYDNNYGQPPPNYNPPNPSYDNPPSSQYNTPPPSTYDYKPPPYNPPPQSNYNPPPQNNNSPPETYKPAIPPYRPPPSNYRPPSSIQEPPPSYNPPPSSYNPPPAPPPFNPPPNSYSPPANQYNPPPTSYPRPTSQPVQPPVYNQEFFMTDDPQVK